MQCRDAQFHLRLRRYANDELGAEAHAELDRHLAGCPECARDARQAFSFDRAISTAMTAVPVPPGLRDKLLTQGLEIRSTLLRRKVYRAAALAASLVLAVGLGYGLFSASRPKLDTDDIVQAQEEQFQDPAGAIKRWLADRNLPPDLPRPFNPELLVSLGSERVQGRDVPVLVFASQTERGFAKLYFFSPSGDFKLDPTALRDAHASNARAEIIRTQDMIYVIVFTGHDLNLFLRAGSSA